LCWFTLFTQVHNFKEDLHYLCRCVTRDAVKYLASAKVSSLHAVTKLKLSSESDVHNIGQLLLGMQHLKELIFFKCNVNADTLKPVLKIPTLVTLKLIGIHVTQSMLSIKGSKYNVRFTSGLTCCHSAKAPKLTTLDLHQCSFEFQEVERGNKFFSSVGKLKCRVSH
jgi:hypothetical protein